MTATKRKYLVRRLVASTVVAVLLAVGLARAFSGGSSTPAPDKAAAMVPSDALVYLNLGTSKGSSEWRRTAAAMSQLPIAGQLRDALLTQATTDALGNLSLDRDIRPWLGNEAAYAQLPGRGASVLLFRVRDQRLALSSIGRAGSRSGSYDGTPLHDVGGGSVAAFTGGWALIGKADAVRRGLDTRAKPAGSLAQDKTYAGLVGGLPKDRVGNAWLSQTWLKTHLAGPAAILAGAARVPAIQSAAVGFGDDGKLMRLAFRGSAAPGPVPGPGCTGESSQSDALFSKAPAHPALFVGMGGAECVIRDLMASPTSAIGKALSSFSAQAGKSGVNVDKDLLPLLGGDSGLSVTPGPTITLEAGDVPAQESLNVLGRLQPALIKLLNPEADGSTPGFSAQNVDGVNALTASLTPGLQLSYAAFDGDLVLSTALSGVGDAKKGDHLAQTKDFKTVLGSRPKATSAVVFLDLQKLLALADQAGLGSNPTYAAVRDDLKKIGAAGAVLSREGNVIDAELRLKNP
jgi:hypothetical protein